MSEYCRYCEGRIRRSQQTLRTVAGVFHLDCWNRMTPGERVNYDREARCPSS
jgi:hypothetical protein